jgi:transcriptional regulator with XRE-family HTH domain
MPMILGYLRLDWQVPDKLGMFMLDLASIGKQIAQRRKTLKLSQGELSIRAGVSRATLDALENARAGELGFSKLTRLLTAVGLELKLQAGSSNRPTLEELLQEDRDDQSLDRRS